MHKLVRNELQKIFAKKSSWILMIILLGIITLACWVVAAITPKADGVDLFSVTTSFNSFVTIFAVVITAISLTEEFSKNTIKILLTRPYSRGQVLFSKLVAIMIYTLCLSLVTYAGSILIAMLFGNANGLTTVSKDWQNLTPLLSSFYATLNNYVVTLFYIGLVFIFAGGFRSLGLAVTMGVGLIWLGSMASSLLSGFIIWKKLFWLKWNPLTQLYLNYRFGSVMIPIEDKLDVGYWPNLIAVLVYTLIFYLIANWIFSKRDISYS